MQKFFSSIIFLFLCIGATLSQNLPFPESNAIWKEQQTTIAGPVFTHTALCGDTLLNGVNFSQVLALQVDSALNITSSNYLGGLRSNGGVVRYLPSGGTSELLLYDFNLEPNEVIVLTDIFLGNTVSRKVDSVKFEMLADKLRKVIYFEPGNPNAPVEYWMEGIGSNFGLLGRASDPGPDHGTALLCFRHGTAYHNQTFIECFLPQLPAECSIVNGGREVVATEPLKLTAQPNPAGPNLHFSINHEQLPEACYLRIYTANGKLLKTVAAFQPEMELLAGMHLRPGFYIATLESERTERVLAHCAFVMAEP